MAKYATKAKQNANNIKIRYIFEVKIHQVQLHTPRDCSVNIVFKTGSKRAETKQTNVVTESHPIADFFSEAPLQILETIYQNKATSKCQSSPAQIIMQFQDEGKVDTIATKLDLLEYTEEAVVGKNKKKQTLRLAKDEGLEATISFTVSAQFVSSSAMTSECSSQRPSEILSDDFGESD